MFYNYVSHSKNVVESRATGYMVTTGQIHLLREFIIWKVTVMNSARVVQNRREALDHLLGLGSTIPKIVRGMVDALLNGDGTHTQ